MGCARCGRPSHTAKDCYAKAHKSGKTVNKVHFVYALNLEGGRKYIGKTDDIQRRLGNTLVVMEQSGHKSTGLQVYIKFRFVKILRIKQRLKQLYIRRCPIIMGKIVSGVLVIHHRVALSVGENLIGHHSVMRKHMKMGHALHEEEYYLKTYSYYFYKIQGLERFIVLAILWY